MARAERRADDDLRRCGLGAEAFEAGRGAEGVREEFIVLSATVAHRGIELSDVFGRIEGGGVDEGENLGELDFADAAVCVEGVGVVERVIGWCC